MVFGEAIALKSLPGGQPIGKMPMPLMGWKPKLLAARMAVLRFSRFPSFAHAFLVAAVGGLVVGG